MIVFTGSGLIAETFKKKFDARIHSFRHLSDDEIIEILKGASVVVHNAANLHPSSLSESVNDNFLLTKRIVDLLLQMDRGIKFIYLSSMSMLKNGGDYKSFSSMSDYAFGKYMGELYTLKANVSGSAVIRFSTLFYGEQTRDGLSALIANAVNKSEIKLINGGVSKRDFIPLEIACQYLFNICKSELHERIINIASGKAVSFNDLATLVSQLVSDVKIISSDMKNEMEPMTDFSLQKLQSVGVINYELKQYVMQYIESLRSKL